ncbi:hypothetical protein BVC80_1799g74 [Macleaya cordata]|uniref:Uncharacterized protein n=1 Tax=Macleaya cordata TaxID=56857 RepID=A0A200QPH1_MACCD|nr:hypothetical protein BVC80_1799g74 [Macleaya cordata]
MAKGTGKLTKLKSVIKKWHSFSKPGRPNGSSIAAANPSSDDEEMNIQGGGGGGGHLHPVYVGGSDTLTVGCEVVLFEHLLWMLENADPQPESLEELVDFYAC